MAAAITSCALSSARIRSSSRSVRPSNHCSNWGPGGGMNFASSERGPASTRADGLDVGELAVPVRELALVEPDLVVDEALRVDVALAERVGEAVHARAQDGLVLAHLLEDPEPRRVRLEAIRVDPARAGHGFDG